jgi:hypothetical protein
MGHEAIFQIDEGPVPATLAGYHKVSSLYEIRQLGLPILRTVVITAWSDAVAAYLKEYVLRQGWARVTIRSDRRPEVPSSPRGGALFDLQSAFQVIAELLASGRVVLVIEPADKYDNLYGVNLLFVSGAEEALLEIVGPGFDVTDLNRGDISPHERISLAIKNQMLTARILKKECVTREEYLASVSQRLAKIGRERLQASGLLKGAVAEATLIEIGSQFLECCGYALLNGDQYAPLPKNYLTQAISYARDLPWRLSAPGSDTRQIVSFSILNQPGPRLVFWDIVRPTHKYW